MKKRIPPVISQILVKNYIFPKPSGFPAYSGNAKNTLLEQVQFFEKNADFDMYAKFWELDETSLIHMVEDSLVDVFDTLYQSLDGYEILHDLTFNGLPKSYYTVWNIIRFQGEIACEGLPCAIYNFAVANEKESEFSEVIAAYQALGFTHFDEVLKQTQPIISNYRKLYDDIDEADYGHSFIEKCWNEIDDTLQISDAQWDLIDGDDIWDKLEDFIQQKELFLEEY